MSARTSVGETPRIVIRCRSTIDQSRSGSGKSGAPSKQNIVAPQASVPTICHGPMIQPMSVSQNRTSSGPQSAWNPTSSAIFARNPPWTCTAPFGRPVVPLVYATNSGCSESTGRASNGDVGAEAGELGEREVAPGRHRQVVAAEARHDDDGLDRRDRGDRRVGGLLHRHELAPAHGAVGGDERLRVGVLRAGSRPRRRRSPEKIGRKIAPSFATAITAATVSGIIGRKSPTASPSPTPRAASPCAMRSVSARSSP